MATVTFATVVPGAAVAADHAQNTPLQTAHTAALSGKPVGLRKNPDIRVDPKVPRAFSAGHRAHADLLIRFKGAPDLSPAYKMNWHDRGDYVYKTLKRFADRAQDQAIRYFRTNGIVYHQLWIANSIAVQRAGQNTFNAMMTLDNVASISLQQTIDLPTPPQTGKLSRHQVAGNSVNADLVHIHVPEVWDMGYRGAGTVVGDIDTGVRYTHEALVNAYRGNLGGGQFDHDYNWFDPYDGSAVPRSTNPHGSHTMGTMVGNDGGTHQIGMAPQAKWISCIGFGASGASATDAGLLACGQFMLAPTKTDGSAADPDLRPDVINNSWGNCQQFYNDWYEPTVDAWIAAGIVPVFSNGNSSNCGFQSPPGLNTVGNPARSGKVLGIGATGNHDGFYATYSNWGPTDNPNPGLPLYPDPMGHATLKPNVVAPGSQILSSGDASDTAYLQESGTSMASPHVAGLVALIDNAAPCLKGDYATIGSLIMENAVGVPYVTGGPDDDPADHVPNEATGWGEIDALATVNAAIQSCGPQGTIVGTVTDAGSSAPVNHAKVTIHDSNHSYTVIADTSGAYSKLVPAGNYTIDVTAYAYAPGHRSGLSVSDGTSVDADFALQAVPKHAVSGTVADAVTGWPLHAQVVVTGAPIAPIWTDPTTGVYSVQLADGGDYTLTASATAPGYADDMATLTGLSGDRNENFRLDALGSCAAPGYAPAQPLLDEDFEGSQLPPSGWSRTSNGAGWQFGSHLGSASFGVPQHTVYAIANDDAPGSSNDGSVDMLEMPPLDFTGVATPSLQFDSFYTLAFGEIARVEVSTDAGATWAPVGGVESDTQGWVTQNIDLVDYAGKPDVRIRFHADDDGGWSSGWAIDNVQVSPGCSEPVAGGLVIGKVSDANTGSGLDGATVNTDPGSATILSHAVDDPTIGRGFFTLYAPEGSAEVRAVLAPYSDASDTVTVPHLGVVRADLALTAGHLVLQPATGPEATLDFGTSQTGTFEVSNDGSSDVDLDIMATAVGNDFEVPLSSAGWTVINHGGDCAWMRNADWGDPNIAGDGFSADANSNVCGIDTVMDTSLVSPEFSLGGTGRAELDFRMAFKYLGSGDYLDVDISIDGGANWVNLLHQVSDASPAGPGVPISIDLGPYIGAEHAMLRFHYVAEWAWYAQVDNVGIYTDTSNISWFNMYPGSMLLASGSSQSLTTQFYADKVLQPGDYMAPLKLFSNTPYSPQYSMAVMHAMLPASYGTLTGTVSTQGYCDADPAVLGGATVTIVGSAGAYQTVTDEHGDYSYQVDSNEAPFTISVAAPEQVQTSQSGVALAAGDAANTDIALRSSAACFRYFPTDVSMSATHAGDAGHAQLSLMNLGAAPLASWSMSVGGDPTEISALMLDQGASQSVIEHNSLIACNNGRATTENHWLRRFDLADSAFSSALEIDSVTFGVDTFGNADDAYDVTARLYTLPEEADFVYANLTEIGSTTVTVTSADVAGTVQAMLAAPITVASDATLVLELEAPDKSGDGTVFMIGTNPQGEVAPSYFAAKTCGLPEPTKLSSLVQPSDPEQDVVLYAEGRAAMPCTGGASSVAWLSISPASSGSLAADGGTLVDLTADSTSLAAGSHEGSVCYASSDTHNAVGVLPVHFSVGNSGNDIIFQDGFEAH